VTYQIVTPVYKNQTHNWALLPTNTGKLWQH